MKNKIFKTIIVGLGNIAVGYDCEGPEAQIATHAKACMAHPRCEIEAGVDPDPEKRRRFTRFTGKPAHERLDHVAGLHDANAFIIATPTPVRMDPVMACAACHPDFILLEKPVAMNWQEALAMERLSKEKKIPIFVNYFRNYLPSIRSIFETMHGHGFGGLVGGSCSYSRGIFNNASHMIALLLHYYGIPDRVQRVGEKKASEPWGDVAAPFVVHFGDAPIYFYSSMSGESAGDGALYFEAGKAAFKNYFETVALWGVEEGPVLTGQPDYAAYQYEALDQMIQCVDRGGETNFHEAMETLRVCLCVKDDGASIEA